MGARKKRVWLGRLYITRLFLKSAGGLAIPGADLATHYAVSNLSPSCRVQDAIDLELQLHSRRTRHPRCSLARAPAAIPNYKARPVFSPDHQ